MRDDPNSDDPRPPTPRRTRPRAQRRRTQPLDPRPRILAEHGGDRRRVLDEHMFQVERHRSTPATCRLQLFTGSGLRAVAVLTQVIDEGVSITNAAEDFVKALWDRYFPTDEVPPLLVKREPDLDREPNPFTLVVFDRIGENHTVTGPDWLGLDRSQLRQLLGTGATELAYDRGDGYRPRPPPPEEQPVYRVVAVNTLPRESAYRVECIGTTDPAPRPRLLVRLLRSATRRPARTCCWYHCGDWSAVSETAIRLVEAAQSDGATGDAIADHVRAAIEAEHITGWAAQALYSLISPPTSIQLALDADGTVSYINGIHRSAVMIETGVWRTIIVDMIVPDIT